MVEQLRGVLFNTCLHVFLVVSIDLYITFNWCYTIGFTKEEKRNAKSKDGSGVCCAGFGLFCGIPGAKRFARRHGHDTSGAVVQGADVIARNVGSNTVRSTTSDAAGSYSMTDLAAGVYEVTVKKESFKLFHVASVELSVAQTLTVNVKLGTWGRQRRSAGTGEPDCH